MSDFTPQLGKRSELAEALWRFRGAFIGVAAFSALINLLMLTGPLFMLQVYDRVLPSRSMPTLVALMILMAALYAFQATLEGTRSRLLVRLGYHLDESLSERLYNAVVCLPLRAGGGGSQPVNDIDHIRSFFASGGPSALADLPWVPLYLAICFLFHPGLASRRSWVASPLAVITICAEFSPANPEPGRPPPTRRRGILCLKRAAETRKSCGRWEWPTASRRAGRQPIAAISALNVGHRTFLEALERCRAPCV